MQRLGLTKVIELFQVLAHTHLLDLIRLILQSGILEIQREETLFYKNIIFQIQYPQIILLNLT
jgi:hypothetical protein